MTQELEFDFIIPHVGGAIKKKGCVFVVRFFYHFLVKVVLGSVVSYQTLDLRPENHELFEQMALKKSTNKLR